MNITAFGKAEIIGDSDFEFKSDLRYPNCTECWRSVGGLHPQGWLVQCVVNSRLIASLNIFYAVEYIGCRNRTNNKLIRSEQATKYVFCCIYYVPGVLNVVMYSTLGNLVRTFRRIPHETFTAVETWANTRNCN